ncbi:FAD-dependent monooxygenase [Rhodococcus maanshanensis]|uniref:FAD-dependent monooxygenase n=1 Tax=Rhodococcus maanshanensis TaxID=183556 RepID=UPI000934F404|nr:FAD-dependent monooxygenase [Rhodococcus maanshanensis]
MTSAVEPQVAPVTADVLIVGAGPVGLTLAVELRWRGVDVIVVDRLTERAPYAKAVGIQPRTVEVWDAMGVARPALDAATTMRGQLVYVNGANVAQLDLTLPPEVPYGFLALPQYETERVLGEALDGLGGQVTRGTELTGFEQDPSGVRATVRDGFGEFTVESQYLVGCDGAHSLVRKGLGISFEGGAFAEEYMLADVEVDWTMPTGYGVRAMHQTDGVTDDLLVCIPLPGHRRYRVSMLVPDELASAPAGSGEIAHGLEGGRRPELRHVQAVLDRLSPQPTTASSLRWSSVFRISHRLAGRYGVGRVFLAGDAAHIHPPTGAQGMNTGVQDAYNLGWKLALAVTGSAAPALLDSYHEERHPVGEEVVGRTVKSAREGIGADMADPAEAIVREAQLLVGYPSSPLVGIGSGPADAVPRPGDRAPDAAGLRQDSVAFPIRLHELFRHPGHTLLLWASDAQGAETQLALAAEVTDRFGPAVRSRLIVAREADLPGVSGITMRDADGRFAAGYGAGDRTGYLVRPDGYVGFRSDEITFAALADNLGSTLR